MSHFYLVIPKVQCDICIGAAMENKSVKNAFSGFYIFANSRFEMIIPLLLVGMVSYCKQTFDPKFTAPCSFCIWYAFCTCQNEYLDYSCFRKKEPHIDKTTYCALDCIFVEQIFFHFFYTILKLVKMCHSS